jgi:hypothetical protein
VGRRLDGENRRATGRSGKVEDMQRNDEEPEHRFPDYPGANTQVMLHIGFILMKASSRGEDHNSRMGGFRKPSERMKVRLGRRRCFRAATALFLWPWEEQ